MSVIELQKTLLEEWIGKKIGIQSDLLTREQISLYQLEKLRTTIGWAYQNSPFYRTMWKDIDAVKLSCLQDLECFPFITAKHLKEQALQLLCVSQSEIHRIVTLDSSGTTGNPKRIYFTASDQELTIDFFQQGMSSMLTTGDRVLILLPGERIGSIGDLLKIALKRAGARPISHGIVTNLSETLKTIVRQGVDCLVGIPSQVLALAKYTEFTGQAISLKSVLLSTDHVPYSIIEELKRVWNCQVFEHYGMTEMGLGGGLDCMAHAGYHLREADLYFEIIDSNGKPVPEGQTGEVVFSTLTRQGMPLIRYRTGDISRFIPEPCPCGTLLRRMEPVRNRKNSVVFLEEQSCFTLADLDEKLFAVPEVIDFTVTVDNMRHATQLKITAWILGESKVRINSEILIALQALPNLEQARLAGSLSISIDIIRDVVIHVPNPAKRKIVELKKTDGKSDNLFE